MKTINAITIRTTFSVLKISIAVLLLNISAAIAQIETKITPDDAAQDDCFGCSVSISGDYAIVGAPGNDDDGNCSGSAYIFVRDGDDWTQQAKLTAEDAAINDGFGNPVSVSGDYAVVGATGDDDGGERSGSAYIFVRDGGEWIEQAKLTADDAAAQDWFGRSVSISGNYAVVGATGDDDDGEGSGSAYIFVREGDDWTQQVKLTSDDAARGDQFGYSVFISGDYAVIGSRFDDDDGGSSGSAYIFIREGGDWIQQAKLTADDAVSGNEFGYSVSISGDYVAIGAPGCADDSAASGSAYIFKHEGDEWTQKFKLKAYDEEELDTFGCSVSIGDDYVVIGSHEDYNIFETGSAYIIRRDSTNWTKQAKLIADDAALGNQFGNSVSISGDYAVIGADKDDVVGYYSGSAYIYNLGENIVGWRGEADIPVDYGIVSAYPNPFNSAICIGFNLKSPQEVILQALDIQGRVIANISQGYYQAGQHQISWDAQSFQSGLYFLRLQSGNDSSVKKVIMIK